MRERNNYCSLPMIICLMMSIVIISAYADTAQATCLGMPLFGDTKGTCDYKKKLKRDIKEAKINNDIMERERKLETLRNNQGVGSGENNTNVFLSGLLDRNGNNDSEVHSSRLVQTRHQIRPELVFAVIPGASQFDDPGMPEQFFFNGVAWEYYLSPNMSVGFLIQKWSVTDGKNFDPILDASGDALYFPGAINRLQYTAYMPTVAFNWQIGTGTDWHGLFRFGIGRNEVQVEFKQIDRLEYPNARQPENITYIDNASILVDIGVEKWVAGMKWGCFARYLNSKTETTDYLNYMNLGSSQIGCSVTFMLQPLGLL